MSAHQVEWHMRVRPRYKARCLGGWTERSTSRTTSAAIFCLRLQVGLSFASCTQSTDASRWARKVSLAAGCAVLDSISDHNRSVAPEECRWTEV